MIAVAQSRQQLHEAQILVDELEDALWRATMRGELGRARELSDELSDAKAEVRQLEVALKAA